MTVTGVDDSDADGNQSYTVVLAAARSSDSGYSGLNPNDVSVTNTDTDVIGDIANYEFDGDYLDSSGNGRHLEYCSSFNDCTTSGTNFSQGVRNQAVEFGNGKYFILAGHSSETIKAISIWIYPTSDSAEQMYFYLSEVRELYLSFGQTYYISFSFFLKNFYVSIIFKYCKDELCSLLCTSIHFNSVRYSILFLLFQVKI